MQIISLFVNKKKFSIQGSSFSKNLTQEVEHLWGACHLRVAEQSSHMIPWMQPDIIIEAVTEIISLIKEK